MSVAARGGGGAVGCGGAGGKFWIDRARDANRYRQYTVPLCLGVRDPGIAELRSMRVV